MIALPPGTKVFLACQPIDLRAGFDGLAAKAQQIIGADPFSGHVFIFRSKRGHYLKGLYWDGSGLCLFAKRLERNKFVWPPIVDGTLTLTPAQLALLIQAMDWHAEVDPILGQRTESDVLTIPTFCGPLRVKGLKDFVTVKGSGYFFLPGRKVIRFLSY